MGGALDPSDAQRLSRVRALLADARRRVRDESDLGLHLAVLAIDGIGELAIGLCVEHLGVHVKQADGVPVRLNRLLAKLRISPPGTKGFGELHKIRNLVQHEGVLPGPEQLVRWFAETEQLVDSLVRATFGRGLSEVWSASGVSDEQLRSELEEAERALEEGEYGRSFDQSWRALELARLQFRQKTGLHDPATNVGPVSLVRPDNHVKALQSQVQRLAEQVELSAFSSEPGEWLWFKQRKDEKSRGLPVGSADAGRALSFVLGWILWFESYIARHGVDRWDRWREEQRAPATGVPGGPHIREVRLGNRPSAPGGRTKGLRNWIFQLTDIPETSPPFDWAIHSVVSEGGSSLANAWVDGVGRLSVTCSESDAPEAVKGAVEALIQAAKAKLATRTVEDVEDEAVRLKIIDRFAVGLQHAGCPPKDLSVRMPRNQHRVKLGEAEVRIDLEDPEDAVSSWFAKELDECFPEHFPELVDEARAYQAGWYDLFVPAVWDPRRVGAWILDALTRDAERRGADRREREAAKAEEQDAIAALQRLFNDG